MIDIAQAKMPDASFINHDFAFGLPSSLDNMKFDFIISTYAFHHLEDESKKGFVLRLKEHLNPGGTIIIGDIAFENQNELDKCRLLS